MLGSAWGWWLRRNDGSQCQKKSVSEVQSKYNILNTKNNEIVQKNSCRYKIIQVTADIYLVCYDYQPFRMKRNLAIIGWFMLCESSITNHQDMEQKRFNPLSKRAAKSNKDFDAMTEHTFQEESMFVKK